MSEEEKNNNEGQARNELCPPACYIDLNEKYQGLQESHNDLRERVQSISNILTEVMFVKVMNGTEKLIPLGQAVGEIWNATQWPRDRRKIFKILSRYEKTKYILKRAVVIIATSIIVLHIFRFNYHEFIKYILNIN